MVLARLRAWRRSSSRVAAWCSCHDNAAATRQLVSSRTDVIRALGPSGSSAGRHPSRPASPSPSARPVRRPSDHRDVRAERRLRWARGGATPAIVPRSRSCMRPSATPGGWPSPARGARAPPFRRGSWRLGSQGRVTPPCRRAPATRRLRRGRHRRAGHPSCFAPQRPHARRRGRRHRGSRRARLEFGRSAAWRRSHATRGRGSGRASPPSHRPQTAHAHAASRAGPPTRSRAGPQARPCATPHGRGAASAFVA